MMIDLENAVSHYRDGAFSAALEKIGTYLKTNAETPIALEIAAEAADRLGASRKAFTYWKKLSTHEPNNHEIRENAARALFSGGLWNEAEKYATELIKSEKTEALGHRLLIETLLRAGKRVRALEYDAALRSDPVWAANLDLVRAMSRLHTGFDNRDVAAQWIDAAVEHHENDEALATLNASTAYASGDYRRAIDLWKPLVKSHDKRTKRRALVNLARARSAHGQTEHAVTSYERVLRNDSKNGEALGYLINRALREDDPVRAREFLDDWPDAGSDIQRVVWIARIAQADGEEQAALDMLDEALIDHPLEFDLASAYLTMLMDAGADQDAFKFAGKFIERAEPRADLMITLIRLAEKTGQPSSQIEARCREAFAAFPDNPTIINQLGGALSRMGKRQEAVAVYRDGIARMPRVAAFWRHAAYLLSFMERFEEADALAARAREQFDRRTVDGALALAEIHENAGLDEEALGYAQMAHDIAPDHEGVERFLIRYYIRNGRYAEAWPLLDHVRRRAPTDPLAVFQAAQVRAGFRYVGTRPELSEDTEDLRFPEEAIEPAVSELAPPPYDNAHGIMHVTSSLGTGGAERQITYVMQGLCNAEYGVDESVTLVARDLDPRFGRDFYEPAVRASGVEIVKLNELRDEGFIRQTLARHYDKRDAVRFLATLPSDLAKTALPLFGLFLERKPRVVHLWQDTVNIAGGLAARLAGVPVIVMGTRSTTPVGQRRYRRYIQRGYDALLKSGDVRFTNNSAAGAHDYEQWLTLAPGTVRTVYNGYDLEAVRGRVSDADRARIRAQLNIPERARVVGGVMRFSEIKRPDLWCAVLWEMCAADTGVHGVIVGDGLLLDGLQAQTVEKGFADRIHFVGRQSPVEPWMAAFDLLFLSSRTEGLPNVLIEAQSVGTPVVTVNVGGAPEALDHGKTGWVLEGDEASSLARQIASILDDEKALAAYRQNCTAFVEDRFGLANMTRNMAGLY